MLRILAFLLTIIFLSNCTNLSKELPVSTPNTPYLIVLGIAQDAGFPQANCQKSCCTSLWNTFNNRKMVSCLGLVDPISQETWLFDATPDFKDQLHLLTHSNNKQELPLSGIFLTHAHIGHYTGLMQLGREAMGAKNIPVYAMPRMKNFLANNGPWSQLVKLNNIALQNLAADTTIQLNERLKVQAIEVPHRDEFSETVGFKIIGSDKSALFIPDIDKWHLWNRDIKEEIASIDYAFLDGTFYKNGEIPNRDMSEIPHPFMEESLNLFQTLPKEERNKVHFIHFNHTNPVLQVNSTAQKEVEQAACHIAKEKSIFAL